MKRRIWLKTIGVWLLLATSMALGTAVTEVVIRFTGIWPPELPKYLVETEDAEMSQEAPFTSCFVAASCHR